MAAAEKKIRIGGASAFWGDTLTSTEQLIKNGDVNYLIYDYLAEVTLSIMAGQKLMDPSKGYAIDFIRDTILPNHKQLQEKKIKVIANAGGVNPKACGQYLQESLQQLDSSLKVAIITGDDLLPQQGKIRSGEITIHQSNSAFPAMCLTLNAYTGYAGIKQALDLGADIIVTGRVADSALTLGILMHEFNWQPTDYHRMSQASLAGHLIECGTQATGGNFTDWQTIEGFENIGFPIVECYENGEFYVDKPTNTGGSVNIKTVAEQLVYEIGDPTAYLLPDLTCDWSKVKLTESDGRVKVSHGLGRAPGELLKVAGTFPQGYKTSAAFLIYGLDAAAKANLVAAKIKQKVSMIFENNTLGDFQKYEYELIGTGATALHQSSQTMNVAEVVLKISATHTDKKALVIFSKELAQASTSLTPGLCQITGGRPKVHPMIKLFTCLIDKNIVQESIHFDGKDLQVNSFSTASSSNELPVHKAASQATASSITAAPPDIALVPGQKIRLIDICHARSGDKGDHANIGVIARHPKYCHILRHVLTAENVANMFRKYLDKPTSSVERFELPGIYAFNFLLKDVLGDGGFASLRLDSQGKGFAQLLLGESIEIPEDFT